MGDVTQILAAVEQGDASAAEQLLPLVYDELRKLAAQRVNEEKLGQTLQPTALVHEAYLRLVNVETMQRWSSRGHFFSAAAEAMRRILVEQARRKGSLKRGGDRRRVDLPDVADDSVGLPLDLLALDVALEKLAAKHPRKAELIKLRFFAGSTMPQAAEMLGISATTADNDWAFAKSWLRVQISADDRHES